MTVTAGGEVHGAERRRRGTRVLAAENPDLTVETRLVRTHPHELVGENLDTGLLVIGGPRRGSTDDLGLVARAALNHATCPVLIVPR